MNDSALSVARWDVFNEDDEQIHSNLSYRQMQNIVDPAIADGKLYYAESDFGDDYPAEG